MEQQEIDPGITTSPSTISIYSSPVATKSGGHLTQVYEENYIPIKSLGAEVPLALLLCRLCSYPLNSFLD